MSETDERYLLICNTSDGLIAQINGVVVQLQFARRLGMKPIVYLHERSYMFGGPNPYFDADQGQNAWDYYFEPIGVSGDELTNLVADGKVWTLSTASELVRLFRWEADSWYMNPYGLNRSVRNHADGPYPTQWWQEQRDQARVFLNDGTVKFQKAILSEVNAFAAAKFSGNVLGLQLRGSDKFDFGVGPNLSRKIVPEEYFPHIDRYLSENPECDRIFVATDQRQWLKTVETAYPDHVISYAQLSLSESDDNMFHHQEKKAARGTEVLADMLLLSRCRYIIKCHAAVGEMALVLNPDIPFIDLNYVNQPMTAHHRPMRMLAAPLIRLMAGLWKRLARKGMALEQVVAINGSDIVVGKNHPRSLNTKKSANDKAPRARLFSRRFFSDFFDWSLMRLSSLCIRYQQTGGQAPSDK